MSWLALALLVVAVVVGLYARTLTLRVIEFRRRSQELTVDYFYIRRLERELGMPPSSFPDDMPAIIPPDGVAREFGLPVGQPQPLSLLAEVYESAVLAGKADDYKGMIFGTAAPSSPASPPSR